MPLPFYVYLFSYVVVFSIDGQQAASLFPPQRVSPFPEMNSRLARLPRRLSRTFAIVVVISFKIVVLAPCGLPGSPISPSLSPAEMTLGLGTKMKRRGFERGGSAVHSGLFYFFVVIWRLFPAVPGNF